MSVKVRELIVGTKEEIYKHIIRKYRIVVQPIMKNYKNAKSFNIAHAKYMKKMIYNKNGNYEVNTDPQLSIYNQIFNPKIESPVGFGCVFYMERVCKKHKSVAFNGFKFKNEIPELNLIFRNIYYKVKADKEGVRK